MLKRSLQRSGICFGVLFTLFAAYFWMYWSWVAATPLSPAQLARVKYNHHAWLTLTIVGAVFTVSMLLWLKRAGQGRKPLAD
jgi:hypothetical protein